jgi:hypothetical protein
MDDKVADKIMKESLIEGVIRGWQVDANYGQDGAEPDWKDGIHDPETFEVVPVTAPAMQRVFAARPDLFTDIRTEAAKVAMFLQEVREADAGN